MRRQRIVRSPAISMNSKVARPSRPLNDQVISQIPGAPSTSLIRSVFGHFGRLRSPEAGSFENAALILRTAAKKSVFSRLFKVAKSIKNVCSVSYFRACSAPRSRLARNRIALRDRLRYPHRLRVPSLANARTKTTLVPHLPCVEGQVRSNPSAWNVFRKAVTP